MKKYRLKKEYPGSPKEGFMLDDSWKDKYGSSQGRYTISGISFKPADYPQFWEEVKEPLFKTEDGVNIFLGDKYCTIEKDTFRYRITETVMSSAAGCHQDLFYYFSTKEKAEEFIVNNKPCLSVKEIMDTMYPKKTTTTNVLEQMLLGLVRKKL